MNQEFKPRITNLFNQAQDFDNKVDLREIILLDSQSTMDLFCNPELVADTFKSIRSVRLKRNGGTMVVNHKSKMVGYHKKSGLAREKSQILLL